MTDNITFFVEKNEAFCYNTKAYFFKGIGDRIEKDGFLF